MTPLQWAIEVVAGLALIYSAGTFWRLRRDMRRRGDPMADGYRYGVRFPDGSVTSPWNGRTQRVHAERAAVEWMLTYPNDRIEAVRALPDGPWETYDVGQP